MLSNAFCCNADGVLGVPLGLPNAMGDYDETPEITASHLKVSWQVVLVAIVALHTS